MANNLKREVAHIPHVFKNCRNPLSCYPLPESMPSPCCCPSGRWSLTSIFGRTNLLICFLFVLIQQLWAVTHPISKPIHPMDPPRHFLYLLVPKLIVTGICWRLSHLSQGQGSVHHGQFDSSLGHKEFGQHYHSWGKAEPDLKLVRAVHCKEVWHTMMSMCLEMTTMRKNCSRCMNIWHFCIRYATF